MEKTLREIHHLRRTAASELEWWQLILASKNYSKIWQATQIDGKEQLKSWEVILSWVAKLKADHYEARLEAIEELQKIGHQAILPELIKILKLEKSYFECIAAKDSLVSFGKEAVPSLVHALKEEDKKIREAAAIILGRIGEEAYEAIPVLMETLDDTFFSVRHAAIQALKSIGKKGEKELVDSLLQKLQHTDFNTRQYAAKELGQLKHQVEDVVPYLLESLCDESELVRKNAIVALRNIGGKHIKDFSSLFLALHDKYLGICFEAAAILGGLSVENESFVSKIFTFNKRVQLEFFYQRLERFYLEELDYSLNHELNLLSASNQKEHRDLVALIYAWKGIEEKAYEFSEKALGDTKKKVELLLFGKTPIEVEKETQVSNPKIIY